MHKLLVRPAGVTSVYSPQTPCHSELSAFPASFCKTVEWRNLKRGENWVSFKSLTMPCIRAWNRRLTCFHLNERPGQNNWGFSPVRWGPGLGRGWGKGFRKAPPDTGAPGTSVLPLHPQLPSSAPPPGLTSHPCSPFPLPLASVWPCGWGSKPLLSGGVKLQKGVGADLMCSVSALPPGLFMVPENKDTAGHTPGGHSGSSSCNSRGHGYLLSPFAAGT